VRQGRIGGAGMATLIALALLTRPGGGSAVSAAGTTELPGPSAFARPPGSPPELPRVRVDMPTGAPAGAVRMVAAGEDLQAVVDAARPGDVLALPPGATFGPLRLPRKTGDEWITIRTSVPDGTFPAPGTRVDPSHAPLMPIIEAASGSAIAADPGAHHFRLVGIEVRPRAGAFLYDLVELGKNERTVEAQPHHIVFERCYLHGDPERGGRRGIAMNSQHTAVVDSYLADFKEAGADSQAVCGWNGVGPFAILNSHLEAAGENVMFGGVDPSITNLVPADIEIRGNHLAKPLAWKEGEAGFRGTRWTVKNLFELKNARRVLVEGNVFEGNWVQSQAGFAILFTVRNQDGRAPWSAVQDVTFRNNLVRHSASGVQILGHDDNHPSQPLERLLIRNTLFEDIGGPRWGGGGRLLQVVAQAADVVVEHVTATQTGNIITTEQGPHAGFVYRDNIAPHNEYGIVGTGTAPGRATLASYFLDGVIRGNVIAGAPADLYPRDNFFPSSLSEVGFVDLGGGDYRLGASSPYRRAASDGKDIGVDFDELRAAGIAIPPSGGPR
jgi:hypothetical protein